MTGIPSPGPSESPPRTWEGQERAGRAWVGSYRRIDGVGHLFSPVLNLASGVVSGLELLPVPRHPGMADVLSAIGRSVHGTALDVGVAAGGIDRAAGYGARLPLRVNLLADTVADTADVFVQLHDALAAAGRRPDELTVELVPPIADPDLDAVVAGARRLRELGYRLCVDEVGLYDHPLALIATLCPEQVKLHPEVVTRLDTDPGAAAVADAIGRLCRRIGAELLADGISTAAELDSVRARGIWHGQGPLLSAPSRRPPGPAAVPLPVHTPSRTGAGSRPTWPAERAPAPGTVAGFAQPAVTLPESVTGGQVRDTFRDAPALTGVVLTDPDRRPVATLNRSRFLLAVSARYGFALHDHRPARDLADPPRLVPAGAHPAEALQLMQDGPPERIYDDVVITDHAGACSGVARIADLLRGSAELAYQHARAQHPLTGLPAGSSLATAIEARLDGGRGFAAGGFDRAAHALARLARALTSTLARFDGSTAAHTPTGDIVVLTDPDHAPALRAALHVITRATRHPDHDDGLPVAMAVLHCDPGPHTNATELARQLISLAAPSPRPDADSQHDPETDPPVPTRRRPSADDTAPEIRQS